jgi:hypothetical protein
VDLAAEKWGDIGVVRMVLDACELLATIRDSHTFKQRLAEA